MGEAGVVEVVAPVEEAFDVVIIKLHAEDSGAVRRHGDGTVGNAGTSAAAVICPQTGNTGFVEFVCAAGIGRGLVNGTGGVEFQFGQRVDDRVAFQIRRDHFSARAVVIQCFDVRFVGDVVVALVIQTALFEFFHQCGNELREEILIFFAGGFGVPAEIFLTAAVDFHDDLRSRLCTPLGEEMRDFEILYAAVERKVDPLMELPEVERVGAVPGQLDVHELGGQTFAADVGVQFRREDGREDHIDAMFHRGTHIAFDVSPVLLRERPDVVVIGDAVRVEPFGVDERLRGKFCGKHGDFAGNGRHRTVPVVQGERNVVSTGNKFFRKLNVHPQRVGLVMWKGKTVGVNQRTDQVGVQTGFGTQKFPAGADVVRREQIRNIGDQPNLCVRRERTVQFQIAKVGRNPFVEDFRAVHDLERQFFVGEHDEPVLFGFGFHSIVEEAFFKGRYHFHL